MILVTGATGFIGNHVARLLLARGETLRLLVRQTSSRLSLDGLRSKIHVGDLRDPASLKAAVRGCRQVYHVAADYRLWSRRPRDLYETNVEGTRNLLSIAQESGVERVIYTSTVGTIGLPDDGTLGTEDSPVSIDDMSGHYKRSKFLAEQVAQEFAANGFPVVIVNPTAPIGERDFRPTPTGLIIRDFLTGRMPAYLDTGLNLVDVRDVAKGQILAADRGRTGERYLLGAENLTLKQIFDQLAEIAGRPAPTTKIPYPVALAAGLVSTAFASVSGAEPRVPLEGVRMARKKMFVDCSKAQRELGFEAGSVTAALARAVQWFQRS
jgi:dihydroflavonol-4-reductase